MRLTFLAAATIAITILGAACGGSDSPTETPKACTPGATQTCVGPGACSGAQACKDDGSGFGACDCGGKPDIGGETPVDTATPDTSDSGTTETGADASDDTLVDVPIDTAPPLLTPDKLPGLSLWLDAGKGITPYTDGTVEVWADQSPNINNAKCKNSFTSGAPVIKSAIKGHDAVKFGDGYGGHCTVDDDPSLRFGTGPFAIIAVMSNPDTGTAITLFQKVTYVASAPHGLAVSLDTNVNVNINVATTVFDAHMFFSTPSSYHAVVVRGPALEIRIDGVATKGKTSTDDVSMVGSAIDIGCCGARELDVAELIAVKGAVSDAQVTGVEAYLKDKYKLTF